MVRRSRKARTIPNKFFGKWTQIIGCTPRGSCNKKCLLEGFLEGSLKEVLLRRVLRRHLVRVSAGQRFLEGFL